MLSDPSIFYAMKLILLTLICLFAYQLLFYLHLSTDSWFTFIMLTGKCNTGNSEDYNCVCHICNKNQSETASAIIRNTRSWKQNKIDWISCNKSGQWGHPQPSRINKKKITKINKCIKAKVSQVQYPLSENISYRHLTVHKLPRQVRFLSISNRKPYLTSLNNSWSIKKNWSASNQISVVSTDQSTVHRN